jgi:D-tagatose-1,6-bisphosphate aldolase subunit GatZ/KbaZ
MRHPLLDIIDRETRTAPAGIAAICSAHPWVLEAAVREAAESWAPALIESTSNQVNQFGGYTGMTPADFVTLVGGVVRGIGLEPVRVMLGADHLGPFPWRGQPAERAMDNACRLASDSVAAGYTKLHLDASMPLADDHLRDGEPLPVETAAQRTAILCAAAEKACRADTGFRPVYVIGTEVPVPGGATRDGMAPEVTPPSELRRTVDAVHRAFQERSLSDAWERVCAVVVQPGVEFGDRTVFRYDREKARGLTKAIREFPRLVFEGHSTDYQPQSDLTRMVEDGIAILKVGPALTFAMREGLFLLSRVEQELLPDREPGHAERLPEVLERAMRANPEHWRMHYRGSQAEVAFSLKYSLSDRARYYWNDPQVSRCVDGLLKRLDSNGIPPTLVSQYFPVQFARVADGRLAPSARALVVDRIRDTLRCYSNAIMTAAATRR